jgi:hypothetical protein
LLYSPDFRPAPCNQARRTNVSITSLNSSAPGRYCAYRLGAVVVRSNFGTGKAWSRGDFMVEVDGPEGLRHHVGPFKFRADAEAWIAQNPSESTPPEPSSGENNAPRRTARIID